MAGLNYCPVLALGNQEREWGVEAPPLKDSEKHQSKWRQQHGEKRKANCAPAPVMMLEIGPEWATTSR